MVQPQVSPNNIFRGSKKTCHGPDDSDGLIDSRWSYFQGKGTTAELLSSHQKKMAVGVLVGRQKKTTPTWEPEKHGNVQNWVKNFTKVRLVKMKNNLKPPSNIF